MIKTLETNVVISIHVLREEDDRLWATPTAQDAKFLSTSSARRTTSRRLG